ncbi:exonuclease domain-containing protein [bacterium]|nr:exonuclease domain-containing protein [bacterium]
MTPTQSSSYGLGNLVKHFGIELTQHHRALPDALATAELLMRITVARTA